MIGGLIVDNSELLLDISQSLSNAGYNCHCLDYDLRLCRDWLGKIEFIIIELVDDVKFVVDLISLIKDSDYNIPVIICSQCYAADVRLLLLEQGVFDYIFIPFLMDELLIRLSKVLCNKDSLFLDGYVIDFKQRLIFDKDQIINLTAKEFDLLFLFFSKQGVALDRGEILSFVWGDDYFGSERVVDDTLRRLRRKLPRLQLHTLYGYGYRLH